MFGWCQKNAKEQMIFLPVYGRAVIRYIHLHAECLKKLFFEVKDTLLHKQMHL